MRVVDEETRRIVQRNRLDALEGDRLFDEEEENPVQPEGLQDWDEEDEGEVASDDDVISSEGEKPDAMWDIQKDKVGGPPDNQRKTRG